MQVVIEPECDNAPRKAQIRNWLIAVSERRTDAVLAVLSDDVDWQVVGGTSLRGRDDVERALDGPADTTLHVRSLLSHGKQVAAEGMRVTASGQTIHFAHVVTFTGHGRAARIGSIRSYRVEG